MSFNVNARVSIKITVYETTHKKYYNRVVRTTMSKSAKSTFTKNAGGFSRANSKYESQARSASRTKTSSESKETNVNIAGSAGGKSGSLGVGKKKSKSSSDSNSSSSSSVEAVSESVAVTFDDAQSLSTSQESSLSHENEQSLEFQDGTTQIYALIKTTITIDGKSVTNLEERYLTAGLTEHITAGLAGTDRLASWEHKAWRDLFHMDKVPPNSLYSYDLQWPAKTVFRTTRVGRNALYHSRIMVWTPGDFVFVVCGLSKHPSGIVQVHKKFGILSQFADGDFHRLEAMAYLETDKKGGMLYVVGSKKASDSTPDEHKIYRINLLTGVSEIVNVKIPGEQEVKGMAGFNGKLYYMSMPTPEKMEVCAFDPDADEPTISKLYAHDECNLERDFGTYTMTACPDGVYFTAPCGRLNQLDEFGKVSTHYGDLATVGRIKSLCFSDGLLYGTTTEWITGYFIPPSTAYGIPHDVSRRITDLYHPDTGNHLTWSCICGGSDGVFGIHVWNDDGSNKPDPEPGFHRYHRVRASEHSRL